MHSLFLWGVIACGAKEGDTSTNSGDTSTEESLVDTDGDGFTADVDCNDDDATVFPGSVAESADLCLLDADGDGFGDAGASAPYDAGTDCNDTDSFTFPGAAENESASACQTDADEDGYGATSPADGAQAGQDGFDTNPDLWVIPAQGTWNLSDAINVENNCEIDEGTSTGQEATSMNLTSTGDAGFEITFEGASESTACTISGGSFSCSIPNTNESVVVPILNDNVTVDLQFSTQMTGTFSAGSAMEADFVLSVSCTGTDNLFISCGALEDYLPCSASWTLPATAAQ